MRREQLEHAIRAACEIIGATEVIVVGSQAILGSFREDELPAQATMSAEVDILPMADTAERTEVLAEALAGAAGELSQFEQTHGFSIDGVDLNTAVLADGWRERLVKVKNGSTAPTAGAAPCTGWCLSKEDICVAKLCAFREKDRNFVGALLDAGLVDAAAIAARLAEVPEHARHAAGHAQSWLDSR